MKASGIESEGFFYEKGQRTAACVKIAVQRLKQALNRLHKSSIR
jgi:hypothetical protein